MNKYFTKLVSAILFLSFSANGQIKFPIDSTAQVVSDGMIVDGVKMQAWDFKSKKSLDFNLDFYKNSWMEDSEKYTHVQHNGWDIINAVINNVIYTAKLKSAGESSSYGYIAMTSKLDAKLNSLNKQIKDFPQPNNTQLIREIKSIDGAKKSSTLILSNKLSVLRNLSFYDNYYKKFNWTINKSMYKDDKKQGAFLASNGPSNVSITFNNSSGITLITAVRVDVE